MSNRTNEYGQPIGPSITDWKPPSSPARVGIEGRHCALEPLDPSRHTADLLDAHKEAPDSRAWTYLFAGPFQNDSDFHAYVKQSASSSDPMHFAVVDSATRRALGTMSLMRMDLVNGVIEVGHIAFSPSLQQTIASTEAQYLLMRHVFEELGYRRYEWKCDHLNDLSRRAALRLGFRFEGIFRQAVIYKQRSRDTAWYSVIDSEWPLLRDAFERWLSPGNFDGGKQKASLAEFRENGA